MGRRPRRNHSVAFKAKEAIEAPPVDLTALHAKIGRLSLAEVA